MPHTIYLILSLLHLMSVVASPSIMARSFKIESTVRGHHAFKNVWAPTIGEDLRVTAETDKTFDVFAVVVCKDNIVVGHVSRELSRVCWYFLQRKNSQMACMVQRIKGAQKFLERVCRFHALTLSQKSRP